MNMSKHRENRVSDVIAYSTGVEFFSRTDLSLRIQSPALSIHNQRCQKGRRTSSDETDDSQLNAGSPPSIFFQFEKSLSFPSSKYRQQTSTTCVPSSRWLFCWAFSYNVRNFCCEIPAALSIAATSRNKNLWNHSVVWDQLMITERLAMGMLHIGKTDPLFYDQ
jgi:hypothetical protein